MYMSNSDFGKYCCFLLGISTILHFVLFAISLCFLDLHELLLNFSINLRIIFLLFFEILNHGKELFFCFPYLNFMFRFINLFQFFTFACIFMSLNSVTFKVSSIFWTFYKIFLNVFLLFNWFLLFWHSWLGLFRIYLWSNFRINRFFTLARIFSRLVFNWLSFHFISFTNWLMLFDSVNIKFPSTFLAALHLFVLRLFDLLIVDLIFWLFLFDYGLRFIILFVFTDLNVFVDAIFSKFSFTFRALNPFNTLYLLRWRLFLNFFILFFVILDLFHFFTNILMLLDSIFSKLSSTSNALYQLLRIYLLFLIQIFMYFLWWSWYFS